MDSLKIDVYVLCRDERAISPFMVDYWKALSDNVDVYVYDQNSGDGTREYLSQYDFIHIIDRDGTTLNDPENSHIKNTCWKKSIGVADFVMVSDFDETIFSYDVHTLRQELINMKDGEYSVLAPLSFNLLGDDFPEYTKGKYLHELVKYGFNDYTWYTKSILFDPNKIKEINFGFGAHNSNPTGDVKWYRPDNLFLIHAKFLGLDYYMYRIKTRRISDTNRMCGLYAETEKNDSELRKTYFEHYGERFDWFDIKDNFETYYNTKQDWSIWGGAKR